MKKMLMMITCACMLSCSNQEEKIGKLKLTGYDYRLFKKTPVWTLAKAVKSNNISKIREEVIKNKMDPDYQESQYGNTLLMLAVFNDDYVSAKALLDVGADPNLRDRHRGANAVIDAAANKDVRYLKLLLAYKGNPNVVENRSVKDDDLPLQTALTSAISYYDSNSFEKVKLLIAKGADVNFPNNADDNTDLPLGVAVKQDKMDVALYLLQQGADYKKIMYKMINGHNVYILEALRKCIFGLETRSYREKMNVVAFLRKEGLEYEKEPIPDYVLKDIKKKYPANWSEYIKKY